MKQTAVESLQEKYYDSEGKLTKQDFEKANEIFKEQIINAYYGESYSTSVCNGTQYYQETYQDK
jgi:hypothetical protein